MSEDPVIVSTDGLESWNDAVHRAERGETVAVIAHGKHIADVVPSGELERLREMIDILSDTDLMQDIRDGLADLHAGRVVPADQIAADLRNRSAL
jgi:antitoxin (DNA-binding transcriptional repressor) of toxin-antitoxin stability system